MTVWCIEIRVEVGEISLISETVLFTSQTYAK